MPRGKGNAEVRATFRLICMLPFLLLALTALMLETLLNLCVGAGYIILNTCWSKVYYFSLAWLDKNYYYKEWLRRDLADCETILELGCGQNSPIIQMGYGKKTDAIDVWQPYIDKHNEYGRYRKCWLCDVLDYNFPSKAYDAVVMLDVLEHLPVEKVKEIDLFGQMGKCAQKKVIIFTPNGFTLNIETDKNPYQFHMSEWQPMDYKIRGYKVVGGTGLKYLFNKGSCPKSPELLFYILGMISQPLIYHIPKLAYHSYAVKEIK